jgi:hypothetical protein
VSTWPDIKRPTCATCRRPSAVGEDYERFGQGEGQHLCWEDPIDCQVAADGVTPELEVENERLRSVVRDAAKCGSSQAWGMVTTRAQELLKELDDR